MTGGCVGVDCVAGGLPPFVGESSAYATQMRAPARPSAVTLRHDFEPTDNTRLAHLCGAFDQHLRSIEAALLVQIGRRGAVFRVDGEPDPGRRALALLQSLYAQADSIPFNEVCSLRLRNAVEKREGEKGQG